MSSIDTIGENFLVGAGSSVYFLGAITANSSGPTIERIDVTDYVRSQTDGVASFMVIREVRFGADPLTGQSGDTDPDDASFWMASLEYADSASRPALELVKR
jgi:hypothetical protein